MTELQWEVIPKDLVESRLVLHHAVQLVAAAGQSLLPARPDDSQQSLSLSSRVWLGKSIGLSQVGLDPVELSLSTGGSSLPLGGRTPAEGLSWLEEKLGAPLALPKHPPDFPHHALSEGARFPAGGAESRAFLAQLFGATQRILAVHLTPLRMWPHHFDLACTVQTANLGFSPGDGQDGLPYWYATFATPKAAQPALGGGGRWRTSGWAGAELPLSPGISSRQVEDFFQSVVAG